MRAALFDSDGVARVILTAAEAAVVRTANHYGFEWREVDPSCLTADDVPPLSTFPPRD